LRGSVRRTPLAKAWRQQTRLYSVEQSSSAQNGVNIASAVSARDSYITRRLRIFWRTVDERLVLQHADNRRCYNAGHIFSRHCGVLGCAARTDVAAKMSIGGGDYSSGRLTACVAYQRQRNIARLTRTRVRPRFSLFIVARGSCQRYGDGVAPSGWWNIVVPCALWRSGETA